MDLQICTRWGMHRGFGTILATLFAASGCSSGASEKTAGTPQRSQSPIVESLDAAGRIEALRQRFVAVAKRPDAVDTEPRPTLGVGVASGFQLRNGSVHALIPVGATPGVRSATVSLPTRASGPVVLEDDGSHVAVSFRLRGAADMPVSVAGGIALYSGALVGLDVLHRVQVEGTEDYVAFDKRPTQEEISYEVDVSRVAGLRLVSNTLEFLDARGVPRLHVAPPYVVDANDVRSEARLAVEGCAFDSDVGRTTVISPGAARCGVRVAWSAAAYPALLDPSWTTQSAILVSNANVTGSVSIPWNPGPDNTQGAAVLAGMGNLALDSTYVYYAASNGIFKVLKSGGTPTQLTSQAASAKSNLQVYSGYAFFLGSDGQTVYTVPTAGGTATSVGVSATVFAVDANGIWYATAASGSLGGNALVGTPPTAGTAVAGLSAAGPAIGCMGMGGSGWSTIPEAIFPTYPLSIFSDGTTVYLGYSNGYVTETSESMPAQPAPPVMPSPPPGTVCWSPSVSSFGTTPNSNVLALLTLNGTLYASQSYDGSGNLFAGSGTAIAFPTAAFSMATDGVNIWYGDDPGVYTGTQGGALYSMPVGGGTASSLSVGSPGSVVTDSQNVYFTASSYQGTSGSYIITVPTSDGAGCSCSGVDNNGSPVNVSCGQTTCGQGTDTYLCNSTGWSFSAYGCGAGGADAGSVDAGCSCSGQDNLGNPVNVSCGQTTCGQGTDTYLCSSSGWSFSWYGCSSGDAGGAEAGCSCSGQDNLGNPVNVSCGQTTCGQDTDTYLCSSNGWSFSAYGCTSGDAGSADAGCSCSGQDNLGNPVTVSCGQTTCGQGADTYLCSSRGWSFSTYGCSGGADAGGADAGCSCSGQDNNGNPVTVSCGETTCGQYNDTYLCSRSGWSLSATGCSTTDSGTGGADSGGAVQLTANPTSLNLGTIPMETIGPSYTSTVTNIGSATTPQLVGESGGTQAIVQDNTFSCLGSSGLGPNQTCSITFHLDCTQNVSSGVQPGSSELLSSADGTAVLNIPLQGTCACLATGTACVKNADCCNGECTASACN